jgi:hypothetical protein
MDSLSLIPLILAIAASLAVFVLERWRWNIIALAVQYAAVFWLMTQIWPVGLAAVKLVAGWMAGAALGASQPPEEVEESFRGRSGLIFRVFATALVWIVIFSITPDVKSWLPLPDVQVWSSLGLVGMGLLQLGMTNSPLRIVLGLLTVLSGFEILYAAVESSVLVAGLLAMVTLGLALVGAYLIAASVTEEPQ